jgi:hypothetical protein
LKAWLALLAFALSCLSSASLARAETIRRLSPRSADVQRFAVLIGNDIGQPGEAPLRYAESDASRMADVLSRVSGFAAENVAILKARNAEAALNALITVNDRIRTSTSGSDSMLLVYYSGHGDRSALHLGQTELQLTALERLVRGSAATVRLLIVDACHSGALTRVKGGRPAPRISLDLNQRLSGEGIVFLTSSSASEQAQESDELGSSFFTHYLASGLLGAADQNEDGRVVLKEAYRHAYEHTILASSRTEAGIQHPTFRDELGGQGDIVLSQLSPGPESGRVRLPSGTSFLLFPRDGGGPVVFEVAASSPGRVLHVKAGRYFVRGRGPDYLLEGPLEVPAGSEVTVDVGSLSRVDYARMVRRGAQPSQRVHGPFAGYQVRSAIIRGASACQGPLAGYLRESPELRWSARVAACRGRFSNPDVSAHTDEVALEGRVARVWDTPFASFDIGAGVGMAWLRQSFRTDGVAPDRNTVAPYLNLGGALVRYLPGGFHAGLELSGLGYGLVTESTLRENEVVLRFAARIGLQLGIEFMAN